MIFKQNVHLTIGLSELPLVNVGDRQFRELCLSAPRSGYKGHKICGRILEVCNVGGDWLTLAVSITSPGTQIIACIEKRGGEVSAVHAYDPYDLAPGVEGRVSYVYFENADEVITVHGYVYGQRFPGEPQVDEIWGDPVPGDPPVANEFAFLNHRTVKFRDEESDNVWVGEFTGRLLLPEWALDGTLEGAVPAEVAASTQEARSVDNVTRILKQDIDHIAIKGDVTCTEVQAMATGTIQMAGSMGISSVPETLPQRQDITLLGTAIRSIGSADAVRDVAANVLQLANAVGRDQLKVSVVARMQGTNQAYWRALVDVQGRLPNSDDTYVDVQDAVPAMDGAAGPRLDFSIGLRGRKASWEFVGQSASVELVAVCAYDGTDYEVRATVPLDLKAVVDELNDSGQWRQVLPVNWINGRLPAPFVGTLVLSWIDEDPDITIDDGILWLTTQQQ